MSSITVRKQHDIASAIRDARERSHLTQADLADKLAIPVDYVGDLESARSTLYISRLLRVLHALDITVSLQYGDKHVSA